MFSQSFAMQTARAEVVPRQTSHIDALRSLAFARETCKRIFSRAASSKPSLPQLSCISGVFVRLSFLNLAEGPVFAARPLGTPRMRG